MFENPRRGSQARNFTTNVPTILDLKSSSEEIFSENCRWVPLVFREGFDTKLKQFVFKMLMTSRFSWAAKAPFTYRN